MNVSELRLSRIASIGRVGSAELTFDHFNSASYVGRLSLRLLKQQPCCG
jgi:hypothetical protein